MLYIYDTNFKRIVYINVSDIVDISDSDAAIISTRVQIAPQFVLIKTKDVEYKTFGRSDKYIKEVKRILLEKDGLENLDMPSKTKKQAKLMAAAAHDPEFAKKVGIKQSVAKEFNKADKGTGILKKNKRAKK